MTLPLIRAIGLRKEHRVGLTTVQALRGVSVELRRGEFVAVVGPSGSSKSTLLNLLGLLDRPTEGSYCIAARMSSGSTRISGRMSVTGGSALSSRPSTCSPAVLRWKTLSCLWFMLASPSASASGGPKPLWRRWAWSTGATTGRASSPAVSSSVLRSRALVNDPLLILADEPTGALDSRTSLEILAHLQGLNDASRTIVLVTHDPAVARHTRRVLMMRDGCVEREELVPEWLNARALLAEAQQGSGTVRRLPPPAA